VHAQLLTRSKLFCVCATAGEDLPNTRTCPVCLGHPGALPVLNPEAARMAVRAGTAFGGALHHTSRFARKHYFYPDLPKGYQITQYERPFCTGGALRFRLPDGTDGHAAFERIHLEEDAGKLLHDGSRVRADYNRSGIPLLEIVTQPVLASPEAAVAFLQELRRVLMYLGISDGSMERASFRCDANVSLRDNSGTPGQRTEIKNLNSFRHIEHALHWEISRQRELHAAGMDVQPVTLLWDEAGKAGRIMRGKESAADYHYLDDPDLPEMSIHDEEMEIAAGSLPELPLIRAARFVAAFGLTKYDADVLTGARLVADYFEEILASFPDGIRLSMATAAAHWVGGEVLAMMKEQASEVIPVPASHLALLLEHVAAGSISRTASKQVFDRMWRSGEHPDHVIAALDLRQISDADSLRTLAGQILKAHPAQVQAYRDGKKGLLGFFMQKILVLSQGKADPLMSSSILSALLESERQEPGESAGRRSDPEEEIPGRGGVRP